MKKVNHSITKNLGKTIREIRENKSPKPSLMHISKQVGISYQHLSDIEREVEENYRIKTVEKIAEALDIDFIELLLMASGKPIHQDEIEKKVPVVGYANTKHPKEIIVWNEDGLPTNQPIDEIEVSRDLEDPQAYGLIVKDNSMGFVSRDWMLIVSPKMDIGHLDPVIVMIEDEVLFRRIEISSESYKFYTMIEPNNPIIVPKHKKVIIHKIWEFRCPW